MSRFMHFIATLWCLLCAPVMAQTSDIWSVEAKMNPRLGLAFPGSDVKFYPLIKDAGIGVVRLSASWNLISPREGVFNFQGLDGRIRALTDLGISPFVTFESNAEWGVVAGQKVKNAEPLDLEVWADFISRVVERYDGDGIDDAAGISTPIKYYQVANEFLSPTNRSGGWAGSHAALLAYINRSYDAVKKADPKAQFVLGGIAAFNIDSLLLDAGLADFTVQQHWSLDSKTVFDLATLQSPEIRDLIENRFMKIVREARYDVADVHLYGPEARDPLRITFMRDVSAKPVVSAECGGPSLDYGKAYSGQAHFKAVLERNLIVLSQGAGFCLWFGLGEGITATYGNSRVQLYDKAAKEKPGVVAYRLLSRLVPPTGGISQRGSGVFVLDAPTGQVCVAVNDPGLTDMQVACATQTKAICIKNADRQLAEVQDMRTLAKTCPSGSVALSGSGLWPVLKSEK